MQVPDGYQVHANRDRIDRDAVWAFLSTEAYWARWRTRADVEAQLDGAWRIVGCRAPDGSTVGYARAISDAVDFAYLADVFVVEAHRGKGLARALLAEMIDNGPGRHFRWMLHTSDAHGLYRGFGFHEPGGRVMERGSGRG